MPALKDITGNRYGRLVVLGYAGVRRVGAKQRTATLWNCKCDCGSSIVVIKSYLIRGTTKSCGCLKRETNQKRLTTHGKSKTRLYKIWIMMRDRCINPSSSAYEYYGGRGIYVCDEWIGNDGFQRFSEWATNNGYADTLTIERIDVNSGYAPDNCKWITRAEQMRNRTNTHWVHYSGETYTLSEASKKFGFDRATIRKHEKKHNGDSEKAMRELIKREGLKVRAM